LSAVVKNRQQKEYYFPTTSGASKWFIFPDEMNDRQPDFLFFFFFTVWLEV
jgi:hypothetical protein